VFFRFEALPIVFQWESFVYINVQVIVDCEQRHEIVSNLSDSIHINLICSFNVSTISSKNSCPESTQLKIKQCQNNNNTKCYQQYEQHKINVNNLIINNFIIRRFWFTLLVSIVLAIRSNIGSFFVLNFQYGLVIIDENQLEK
jgi:hypothetical protein